MGLGGISIWQLLIVLAIVIMLFGTKRLRTLGGDLGSAVKGFRNSMQDDGDSETASGASAGDDADVADASTDGSAATQTRDSLEK